MKILGYADMFGYNLKPTFNGKQKLSSLLGATVSIIFCFLLGLAFFYSGKEIIDRRNPFSNISSELRSDPEVSLKDIPIGVSLATDDGQFLTLDKEFSRSLTIKAMLISLNNVEGDGINIGIFNIPLAECNEGNISQEYKDIILDTYGSTNFLKCLDLDSISPVFGEAYSEDTVNIRNPFGLKNSNHLNIYLELCDEKADPGCRDYINSIGSFHFLVMHGQQHINMGNFTDPFINEFKLIDTTVYVGFSFSQIINFSVNELITDEGWIVEEKQSSLFYSADAPLYNVGVYSEVSRSLGRVIFGVNRVRNILNRRYMKVQELLANLGGFMKIALLSLRGIMKYYSEWCLINEMLKIEGKQGVSKSISVNNYLNSTFGINNPKTKVTVKPKKTNYLTLSAYLKSILGFSGSKNQKISLSWALKALDLISLRDMQIRLERQEKTNKEQIY